VPIEKPGPPVDGLEGLGISENTLLENGGVQGEVISFDRFGNAVTSLTEREVFQVEAAGGILVWVGRRKIGSLRRTFSDVGEGEGWEGG
jgi:S-adenosylmethionine hydrolase